MKQTLLGTLIVGLLVTSPLLGQGDEAKIMAVHAEKMMQLEQSIKRLESNVVGMSGMMAYFASSECPAGWEHVSAAKGRTIVVQNEAVNETKGAALAANGQRYITEVPAHSHSATVTIHHAGEHTHAVATKAGTNDGKAHNEIQGNHDGGGIWKNHTTTPAGNHTHKATATIHSAGKDKVDVTMPYIQLNLCRLK